jgi:transposase InsO family protein
MLMKRELSTIPIGPAHQVARLPRRSRRARDTRTAGTRITRVAELLHEDVPLGCRVEVLWRHGGDVGATWYAGYVLRRAYRDHEWVHFVRYDDGDTYWHSMRRVSWRRLPGAVVVSRAPSCRDCAGEGARECALCAAGQYFVRPRASQKNPK